MQTEMSGQAAFTLDDLQAELTCLYEQVSSAKGVRAFVLVNHRMQVLCRELAEVELVLAAAGFPAEGRSPAQRVAALADRLRATVDAQPRPSPALAAATAELAEAHEVLDANEVPRATAMHTPYSLPDRVKLALHKTRQTAETMGRVQQISTQLAALVKRHGGC